MKIFKHKINSFKEKKYYRITVIDPNGQTFLTLQVVKDENNKKDKGRKPGLVDSKLDSWSKVCGFESHPTLDGNGVKTLPGWLKYPILVHSMIEKKKIQVAKWGTPKTKYF